jgi:hypothetical protein
MADLQNSANSNKIHQTFHMRPQHLVQQQQPTLQHHGGRFASMAATCKTSISREVQSVLTKHWHEDHPHSTGATGG